MQIEKDEMHNAEVLPSETSEQTRFQGKTRRGSVRKFFRGLGPGLITGAADDDPSGISTYSTAGAAYGLYKKVAGTFTLLQTIAVTPANGDVLRLVVSGTDSVTAYVNGTAYGPYTATGISSSSVNAGIGGSTVASVQSTARFSSFASVS